MKSQFSQAGLHFVSFLLILLLTSCAQLPKQGGRPELPDAVESGFAQEQAPDFLLESPPTAQQRQMIQGGAAETPQSAEIVAPEEARFNISANSIQAREFFLGLVEFSDTNMVVHPEVEGEVTVALKNVTVTEVMDIMRNVYGYEYRRTGGGYQILPGGIQSRIYQVDYLNLSRKGISKTRISSGQVSQAGGGEEGVSESVSGSEIDTQTSSDFWVELETALNAIVGNQNGRQVVVHPQGNLVIIRALPQELSDVENYLEVLQGNLVRQVILETKILEVVLNDGFQSGINWSALPTAGSIEGGLAQTGGGTLLNSGISELAGQTGLFDPIGLTDLAGDVTSAFGGAFAAALKYKDFSAFIELLETQGDVQVLSSPRISTVNNQKAVIKVGDDEFFVTDVSSDTVTGTTSNTSLDITLTPFFSGIALDVTPQIDASGVVTLHIHPTVSEVTDQQKVVTVGSNPQVLPLAFSSVRESDSIVRAASGQVVVIGGLMKNNKARNVAGVPLLGDLPLLGSLFRHSKTEATKSELVILLRPIVVQGQSGWDRLRQNARQRFDALNDNADFGWQGNFSVRPQPAGE